VNIGIPEWIQQPRPEFAVLELDHVIVSAGLDFLKICAFAVRAVCETHADKCEDDKTAPVGRHVAKACLAPNLNECDFGVRQYRIAWDRAEEFNRVMGSS